VNEIAAISGHKNLAEIARYTQGGLVYDGGNIVGKPASAEVNTETSVFLTGSYSPPVVLPVHYRRPWGQVVGKCQ
jgi:hypothetical protein